MSLPTEESAAAIPPQIPILLTSQCRAQILVIRNPQYHIHIQYTSIKIEVLAS